MWNIPIVSHLHCIFIKTRIALLKKKTLYYDNIEHDNIIKRYLYWHIVYCTKVDA